MPAGAFKECLQYVHRGDVLVTTCLDRQWCFITSIGHYAQLVIESGFDRAPGLAVWLSTPLCLCQPQSTFGSEVLPLLLIIRPLE